MAASDYASILTALGPKNASAFIQALEERGIYVIDSSEDPTDLNAGNIFALLFNGVIFWYDPADATTVHDGVTCIVTAEGRRYKSDQYNGISSRWVAVIDKDLTAPPGAPALQDTYIVAAGGTGDWATHDKKFATWTARGWVFLTPKAFDYAYVIDEALIYHYNAGGVWTAGIPAITVADSSLSRNKLNHFKLGPVSVENQTTNTPPGAPADGVAYVVAGAPTGAWVGHSLEVAIRENGAWVYYTPYEGAHIYDKALDKYYRFNGATWDTPAVGKRLFIAEIVINSLDTEIDFINLGAYRILWLTLVNVRPSADDRQFWIRLSSDNGVTFIATGSTYNGANHWEIVGNTIGANAADGGCSGEVLLMDFNIAQKTKIFSEVIFGNNVGALVNTELKSWQTAQTAMNAIRFLIASNTLAGGVLILEGLI